MGPYLRADTSDNGDILATRQTGHHDAGDYRLEWANVDESEPRGEGLYMSRDEMELAISVLRDTLDFLDEEDQRAAELTAAAEKERMDQDAENTSNDAEEYAAKIPEHQLRYTPTEALRKRRDEAVECLQRAEDHNWRHQIPGIQEAIVALDIEIGRRAEKARAEEREGAPGYWEHMTIGELLDRKKEIRARIKNHTLSDRELQGRQHELEELQKEMKKRRRMADGFRGPHQEK